VCRRFGSGGADHERRDSRGPNGIANAWGSLGQNLHGQDRRHVTEAPGGRSARSSAPRLRSGHSGL
jgi:hypothetical protein